MESIVWKNLDGVDCSGYVVSSLGEVLHQRSGRTKRPSKNQYGTYFVNLMDDFGKQRSFPIANLVAYTFIGIDPDHPNRNTLIFKDGDRSNFTVENLAYRTRSYAIRYNKQVASGDWSKYDRSFAIESEDANGRIQRFPSIVEASMAHGVLPEDILSSIRRRKPTQVVEGLRFFV